MRKFGSILVNGNLIKDLTIWYMVSLLAIFFPYMFPVALAQSISSSPFVNGSKAYENPITGVTMHYPTNWQKIETPNSAAFASFFAPQTKPGQDEAMIKLFGWCPNPTSNFYTSSSVPINEIANKLVKIHQFDLENFHLLDFTCNSNASKCDLKFTYTDSNVPVMASQRLVVVASQPPRSHSGNLYSLEYLAYLPFYNKYLPTAIQMLDSFTIRTTPVKFVTYENATYGVKMQYPADWIKKEKIGHTEIGSTGLIVSFRSPYPNETKSPVLSLGLLGIDITKRKFNQSLTDFIYFYKYKLQKDHPEVKINQSKARTLAGNPSYQITFTDDKGLEFTQIWTIYNNSVYHITYPSRDPYIKSCFPNLPLIQAMINSFQTEK
jgi:hypothetical protein